MLPLSACLAAALLAENPAPSQSAPQTVPTVFEAGHFYATPQLENGGSLRLIVDTGGGGGWGLYWLKANVVKRLGLATHQCTLEGHAITIASLPRFQAGRGLPPPTPTGCGQGVLAFPTEEMGDVDGQLGGAYLSHRTWTFDYPGKRLLVQSSSWKPPVSSHRTPLGLLRDERGEPMSGHPRVTMRVDGVDIDMLLDTGATAHLSAAGLKATGAPQSHGFGVASYITTSQLEKWHQRHPAWRVVAKGDDLFAKHPTRLIEVPEIELAGWKVGPVWFTERPDLAFHDHMARSMDKAPEGALGANAYGDFILTIDYQHGAAFLECVSGCRTSSEAN